MQSVDECFSKVKTASFKYISSQETVKEKFKKKKSNDKIFSNSNLFLDIEKS